MVWLCLLEKVWAKLHGNYCSIVEGTADVAFIHLTGMPTHPYWHKKIFEQKGVYQWEDLEKKKE